MKFQKVSNCFLLSLFVLFVSVALTDETDEFSRVIENVVSNFEKINTIEGKISYEIQREDQYVFLEGDYCSAPGNKYRMEFRPAGSWIKIVCNGTKVWFYMEKLKKVYISERKGNPANTEDVFSSPAVAGRDVLSKDLDIKFLKKQRKGWREVHIYEATPKEAQDFISRIVFWIDPQMNVIKKIESYDLHENISSMIMFDKYRNFENNIWFPLKMVSHIREGDIVSKNEVVFENVMINKKINEDKFIFAIPENTKIEHIKEGEYKGEDIIKK
ncbi:MAG: LolA family protein [Candidatus Aminicenantaceae bacterium]